MAGRLLHMVFDLYGLSQSGLAAAATEGPVAVEAPSGRSGSVRGATPSELEELTPGGTQ